jgi:hypothetical protein
MRQVLKFCLSPTNMYPTLARSAKLSFAAGFTLRSNCCSSKSIRTISVCPCSHAHLSAPLLFAPGFTPLANGKSRSKRTISVCHCLHANRSAALSFAAGFTSNGSSRSTRTISVWPHKFAVNPYQQLRHLLALIVDMQHFRT